jgi:hypothetical protein
MLSHEDTCKPIICPRYKCDKRIFLGTVVEHLNVVHKIIGKVSVPSQTQGTVEHYLVCFA